MKVAVFSSKTYDEQTLTKGNVYSDIELHFFESRLSAETVSLTTGFDAISCFVNDQINQSVLEQLSKNGIKSIALRCAGYNNVDLNVANKLGISVYHVPDYSPESVAEHAVALIMTLNRKTHRAYHRVKEGNFSLEGLMGFNLSDKTVGCIGTGRIGQAFAKIMKGFGCRVLCTDIKPNQTLIDLGCQYVDLQTLYEQSNIISLHCPLTEETNHLINKNSIEKMLDGVMIINTSRGALVNAQEAIDALYSEKIGYLGLDVYEQEGALFLKICQAL
ncbi:2-hydroxyacid dehydrogenase [Marinomonas phaeophyticola]|uniref:2-hydroxyacid dehydrogenase n=1 Tax=Marinomonas phaeophyticola TaxID=3004091 RepID=UPI002E808F59|nr:2-hydroxyacid dehydrogenase [Marinomonas sp. 15G1-11]